MWLVIALAPPQVWKLQHYGRPVPRPGGFQQLAAAMLAHLTMRPDESGEITLTDWRHIRQFVTQRSHRTSGGFQDFLGRLSVRLERDGANPLDDWPQVRDAVLAVESAHTPSQIRMQALFVSTCGEHRHAWI